MKRIQSACLAQTVRFFLRDDVETTAAARGVEEEVALYKEQLSKCSAKYRIVEETTNPDGSVELKVLRQYNTYPVGGYMQ